MFTIFILIYILVISVANANFNEIITTESNHISTVEVEWDMNVLNSLDKSIDVNEEVLSMLNGNFYIHITHKYIQLYNCPFFFVKFNIGKVIVLILLYKD